MSVTSCDLTCPGDATLFCGGIIRSEQRLLHRAIAPNRLLTLYKKVASSSTDSTFAVFTTSSAFSLQTTGAWNDETTSGLTSTSRYSQPESAYSLSSFATKGAGSMTLLTTHSIIAETPSESRLPASLPTATAFHTAYSTLTISDAYTKTRFAEMVTTITYTTINPTNPAALITTCAPITLLYSPCGCEHQVYPTVDMTTFPCTHKGGIVSLTVPKAAYETGTVNHIHPIVQYPSGWVGGHQTDAGRNTHPEKRPTTSSQFEPKKGYPESPASATGPEDTYASYRTHQSLIPTSAAGSNGDNQPEQGIPQQSAAAQGSLESDRKAPKSPSQPSSPEKLTTETDTIPTLPFNPSTLPSNSPPPHQGQVPSRAKGVPHATPVVVSEAYKHDLTLWIRMTAIVGVILIL